MDKDIFSKLIRSLYSTYSPEQAFNVSVLCIDALELDCKLSHDLALFGLKLSKAYRDLLEL